MSYVRVFLLGGGFCLITQLLFRVTKRSIPVVLTLTFCAGVIFTATGIMNALTSFGQCGMYLLLYGGGEAAFRGMVSLLEGDPVGILRYCLLLLYCFGIGLGLGYMLHCRHKTEKS